MVTQAYTVAFEGVSARSVEVQCAVTPGLPAFSIVGFNCKPFSRTMSWMVKASNTKDVFTTQSLLPLSEALQPSDGTPSWTIKQRC
jgi:hypothetical protein